jgi:hypothetical protein
VVRTRGLVTSDAPLSYGLAQLVLSLVIRRKIYGFTFLKCPGEKMSSLRGPKNGVESYEYWEAQGKE